MRMSAGIAALTMMMSCVLNAHNVTAVEKIRMISCEDKRIRYTGRFDFSKKGETSFAWSACSVTVRFHGTFCAFALRGDTEDNYVQIIFDGTTLAAERVRRGGSRISTSVLPGGEHTVVLFKRTEANQGVLRFSGIELSEGAELLPPIAAEPIIEFVGDSITCGYGNEAKGSGETFHPETENAYLSYASVCARKLLCRCVTICFSGKGIMRDYGGSTCEPMTELYGRVYPQNKIRAAAGTSADLVVVNIGTNDFATGASDEERFVSAYIVLISQIRRNSPRAPIIILDGPIMNNDWPFKGALDLFRKYRDRIIDRCGRDGLGTVIPFSLSTQGDLGFGADFHPSAAQHEKNAGELARFIRERNILKKTSGN